MLAVNDDCCRENLCLVADTSIPGARVAPVESWPSGDTMTTTSDRTHLWAIKHPLKRVERLSNLRAPRSTRLLKLTTKSMKPKPANSRYK